MKNHLTDYLETYFDEIEPREFYRSIFPLGELEEKGKQIQGKYNAIAVELFPKDKDNKVKVNRYIVNDDLNMIDELLKSDNFIIISPVSYCGNSRESKNARYIYAIAIDLDGVSNTQYITDLFYQMENEVLPKPTYTVCSGSGLHLYYQFEHPIPCYENIVKQLVNLKNDLTKQIWNKYTTELYENPQIESLFQGFRMVGGITKDGINRTRAFTTGRRIDIEYLNDFVKEQNKVKDFEKYIKRGKISLSEAKEKFPEWYEKRVIQQQPRGHWICKRDLFDWWLRRIKEEAKEGHRFYCVMCLSIYAKKSGIEREELEKIAFELVEEFDKLTTRKDNDFTISDVYSALEMYNDDYINFPINSISTLTNIHIEKNKRNGRKQKEHIKYMNTIRKFKIEMGEITLKGKAGRKTKESIVREWQEANPKGTKYRCQKETGLSENTVSKWWFKS